MSDEAIAGQAGAGWGWTLAYGIVSLIAAMAAFAWPIAATITVSLLIGTLFVVSGGFSIAAGITARAMEGAGYAILFGIVSVIIGLIMIFEPATGAISLTLLIVFWLAMRGGLELWWATRTRRRRGWLIALGVINLLLAAYILATIPISALTLPGFILGISFAFAGIDAIMAALNHRRGAAAFAVPS
jgi:uncharacterized membrane protein HdeD (DUF308 family)